MSQEWTGINQMLQEIRLITGTDFVSIALVDRWGVALHWRYALGSRNERYKRMSSSMGGSVCGQVIRSCRPAVIESFVPKSGDNPAEYPILLAEQLQAIIAVPLADNGRANGLLLVGSREPRRFTEEEVLFVMDKAVIVGRRIECE